jgi:serine/threonine protein kinase
MPSKLKPNSALLHYRIISKIGGGGMGEVYLAEDTRLGRNVAIKFLAEEFSHDRDKLQRFIQEAKAASALNHPNILTVHEIGEADGKNYIATEFIEGKTLREHIPPDAPMSIDAVLKIAIQIAEALDAAHRAGIIHRDIKPENVMVRSDGYVKVLDFGLAKLAEAEASAAGSEETTRAQLHTTPGLVMGTIAYMSPEQARGRGVDTRTDFFSLGVVLYELLTGRQPFTGDTTSHAIVAILEKDPPPFASLGIDVPTELDRVIFRSLEKDPAKRYQNAGDLVSELKALRRRLQYEAEFKTEVPTKIFPAGETHAEPANTIAVMPFVNMSRDENGDYFSDGLAEELLNVLSKIRGLRVAARTSAFSFKGKQTTIAEIGRALNVVSVLEGSIRTAGDRVRIAVQLVKVADGYHLWSETYDRTMDDIFAVQDDIAQSVVEELRSRLLGEAQSEDTGVSVTSEVAEAVKGRAADPEAQRLMLLGRYFLDRTTREDTTKAIEYFRTALDLDPGYALCWAELGRAYSVEAGRGWAPMKEGYARVREAIDRALTLEPDLAEGYAIRERIQDTYEWDWSAAEGSMQRAMKLAPGSSAVLDRASVLAYKVGRLDEAIQFGHRVLEQDPLSAAFWHNLGLTCHAAGELAESEKAFRRALELAPQRFVSAALLALVLTDQGRIEEAIARAGHEPDEFWRLWALAIIFNAAGRKADSDKALAKLTDEHAEGNTFQLAEVHAMRGELAEAFAWLARAVDERDPGVTHSKVNPRFRRLHADPRWVDLLKKIGFEG